MQLPPRNSDCWFGVYVLGTYINVPLDLLIVIVVSQSLSGSFNLCYMVLHELSLLLRNYPEIVICFYANSEDERELILTGLQTLVYP